MTKRQAIRRAAKRNHVDPKVMERHVNMFLDYVADALIDGEEVWLAPIGKVFVREMKRTRRRMVRFQTYIPFRDELKRNPIEVPEWYRGLGVKVDGVGGWPIDSENS